MSRKIAVVGAGFAGLSVCWHLLQKVGIEVDLFDSIGIGGGASGVSTGLLHPFPGRLALRSHLSEEGMGASSELIQIAESALGAPVALRTGILRIAMQPMQRTAFKKRAEEDPEAIWVDNVQDRIGGAIEAPGLWIPSGITVFSRLYLDGLWRACEAKGAHLHKRRIGSVQELDGYERVILATGDKSVEFPECASFDIQLVKGQTALCRGGENIPCSLIGIGHITASEDPALCQIGSTYEHGYLDGDPHREIASELLAKAAAFYPPAAAYEVVEVRAGIRIAPKKGYRPIVAQISPRVFLFTGLGSRGLLYHALFGQKIAEGI